MKILSIAILVAACLVVGCTSERHYTDVRHPEIALTAAGGVTFRGKFVDPNELPGLLRDEGFDRHDTINVLCPPEMTDIRLQRRVMGILSRGGFPRLVLVGERTSTAQVGRTAEQRRMDRRREAAQKQQGQGQQQTPARGRTIRYKN